MTHYEKCKDAAQLAADKRKCVVYLGRTYTGEAARRNDGWGWSADKSLLRRRQYQDIEAVNPRTPAEISLQAAIEEFRAFVSGISKTARP